MSLPFKVRVRLLLFFSACLCLRAEVRVGDPFPSLSALAPAGAELPAGAGKVVLVDFWASWCAPCKESFHSYAQLQSDYRSRGLVIVAVSVDEKQSAFDAFVKKLSPPFMVLRDQGQQLVRQVSVPAMPTCYLLGRDGRVRFVHQGFRGVETDRAIRQETDLLLAENTSAHE